jgi:RNA polymerase sigma-70 factor (ECF subfamily)
MNSSLSPFDATSYFEGIFSEYSDEVFRFCITKVPSREEAVDITQDVFGRLWQYIQSGTLPTNPRALLYKMIRNKIIDRYRTKKPSLSLDSPDVSIDNLDSTEDASIEIDQTFDADRIMNLLDELSPTHREVLVLRYLDDLSVAEIAQLLDVSPNTVSIRIHRAAKELKNLVIESDNATSL